MSLLCSEGRAKFCRACDFLLATHHSKRVFDAHQHYTDVKAQQLRMSYELYGQRDKMHAEIEQMGKALDPGDKAHAFIMSLFVTQPCAWS